MDNFLKHFALALRYLLENQGKGKFRMFYFQHSISSHTNCKRLDIALHSHVFEMVIKVIVHYPQKQHWTWTSSLENLKHLNYITLKYSAVFKQFFLNNKKTSCSPEGLAPASNQFKHTPSSWVNRLEQVRREADSALSPRWHYGRQHTKNWI